MKRNLLIIILVLNVETLYCQISSGLPFWEWPLEEKVEYFFNTFRDDHTHFGVSNLAGSIVLNHGYLALPFIKEKLEQANYFTYTTEPKDITLNLISYIISAFHTYGLPAYKQYTPYYYQLTDDEILWFYNEYMRCIDEYVLAVRVIDRTVFNNDINIAKILPTIQLTGRRTIIDPDECPRAIEVDYPCFGMKSTLYFGEDLKRYYEERLGIEDLTIDYSFFRTGPFPGLW